MTAHKHLNACGGNDENCTYNAAKDSVTVCECNGWKVGTILEGHDWGDSEITKIEITAVGRWDVLGCRLEGDYELTWSLNRGCWREVKP